MLRVIPIGEVGLYLRGLGGPCATCGGVRWSYSNKQPISVAKAYVLCRTCSNTKSAARFKASCTSEPQKPGPKSLSIDALLRSLPRSPLSRPISEPGKYKPEPFKSGGGGQGS